MADTTKAYGLTIYGGSGAYTYKWSIKNETAPDPKMDVVANSPAPDMEFRRPVINGSDTQSTVHINLPAANQYVNGLLCCKITENVTGRVTFAYWNVQLTASPN